MDAVAGLKMHEQSETVQRADGKWINVYGRNLPKAGEQLPGTNAHDNLDDAVSEARARSEAATEDTHPENGLINRAIKGVKDINLWDTLHPSGTGSTKRGFSDIYPKQ